MPDEPPTPPSSLAWILKLAPDGASSLFVLAILGYFGVYENPYWPWYACLAVAATVIVVRLGRELGRKLWEKWEPDIIDGLDRFGRTFIAWIGDVVRGVVRRVTDRTESRYLKGLVNRFALFNDKGLGLINTNRLDLERVYVDLRTAADVNLTQLRSGLIEKEVRGDQPFWVFVRAARPGIAFAVIGPPGSGKTTLLYHVVLTFARRKHRRHGVRFRIPILIELRTVADLITEKKPTLGEVAERAVRDLMPRLVDTISASWFDRRLARGQCAVLFDGLDEISDRDKRKAVSKWLDEQIDGDGDWGNLFAVTSRPTGYKSAPLDRAQCLEVQPFTREQSHKFIDNWYVANEVLSRGNQDNQTIRERAQDQADHLHQALRDNPQLNDLTTNPLLLTMIVMVHRCHGALPGSRVQLYAEVCQILLERWRQTRDIKDDKHTAVQKLAVLKPLATHMMSKGIREIAEADALAVMSIELDRIDVGKTKRSEFLHNLQAGSGLLLEKENGVWGFAHHSFQEYLAAAHWGKNPPTKDGWAEYVGDPWWRESLLLYAAQNNASAIVTTALDLATPQTQAFAFDCGAQAQSLEPEIRARLTACLHDALKSHDLAIFTPAAEAWCIRCQHDYTKLTDTIEIANRPVTQAEYQLFLNATAPNSLVHRPPHWNREWFEGDPQAPIVGVTSTSANKFCSWLNGSNPQHNHRLPSSAELSNSTTSSTMSVWTASGVDYRCEVPAKLHDVVGSCLTDSTSLVSPRTEAVSAIDDNAPCDLTFAQDLGHAFDRAFAHALDRAFDRVFALKRVGTRNRVFALDLDRAFNRTHYIDLARARARARDLALALACDIIRARPIDLDLAPALALARDRNPNLTLNHTRDRALVCLIALVLIRATYLPHIRNINASMEREESEIDTVISQTLGEQAHLLHTPRVSDSSLWEPWIRSLSAPDFATIRRESRKFCLEATRRREGPTPSVSKSNRFGLFSQTSTTRGETSQEKALARFRAFLLLTIAREEGQIPAWEGIRVVRERK
jgi:hypothetical protein